MTAQRYYYANEQNQPVGPFTVDELTKMRDQTLIRDDTFICIEDGSDWVPLSQITGTKSSPPPLSPGTSSAAPQPQQPVTETRSSYQKTAETVGMIPDLSGKRNLLQLAITFPVAGVFALFGLLTAGMGNAMIWGLIGLLVGVLASGAVLMVLGWKKDK